MEKENTLKLKRCNCGGTVELIESKPWNQDPCIYCSKCGGKWKYGTYSDLLTIKEWTSRH